MAAPSRFFSFGQFFKRFRTEAIEKLRVDFFYVRDMAPMTARASLGVSEAELMRHKR